MTPLAVLVVLFSACIHATWNLVAHTRRTDSLFFLRALLVTGAVGIVPALWGQIQSGGFPAPVWGALVGAGFCEGLYLIGLTMGYRAGDFSTVYPVARALPVLLLAAVDVVRGRDPSLLGWIGIVAVSAGCLWLARVSLHQNRSPRESGAAFFWIGTIALATTGYTVMDKMALEQLPAGLPAAIHYGIWQSLFTLPFLLLNLRFVEGASFVLGTREQWRWAAAAALFIAGAYWLILWTYQLTPYASYIVGLRQFSIVLGVVVAVSRLGEQSGLQRILAAVLITAGIIAISLA